MVKVIVSRLEGSRSGVWSGVGVGSWSGCQGRGSMSRLKVEGQGQGRVKVRGQGQAGFLGVWVREGLRFIRGGGWR